MIKNIKPNPPVWYLFAEGATLLGALLFILYGLPLAWCAVTGDGCAW